MESNRLSSLTRRLFRRGLRRKIIAWSFVPTAILLLAVALVTFFAFQSVTEELALERDLKLTSITATQLTTELREYEDRLNSVARTLGLQAEDPIVQQEALQRAANRFALFDGGVLLLGSKGSVIAAQPPRPELLGQNWSDRGYYQEIVRSQIGSSTAELILSNIVTDGPDSADVIVMAYPVLGQQNQFLGALLGMFRITSTASNAFYGDILKLRIGGRGNIYLVDGHGRVIYHSDIARIGEDFSQQTVVQRVLNGQVDALRTRDYAGNSIVAGFAPVPRTPWGLVTEETWANLTSGFRGYRNFLLALLVLGVIVPAAVVSFGVRRVTKPISDLIAAAQEVARGNFGQAITAETGDEIEALAEQFNSMSAQLQESYANLEQRVADRTKELATLNAIAAVVSRSLDLDEILCDALDEALAMFEAEAGGILLLDPEQDALLLRVHKGHSQEFVQAVSRLRLDEGISGRAVARGKPVVLNVPDYPSQDLAPVIIKEGLQTLASTPLLHKGEILGVLNLATRRPRAFPSQELLLLTAIGQQIGVAVENARLYEQTQQELLERKRTEQQLRQLNEERARHNRELALLNRVIAASTSRLEINAVLEAVCRELTQAFGVPSASAALLEESGDTLTVVAEHKVEGRPSAIGAVIPVADNPSTQYVLEHKAPLAITDALHDPRLAPVHHLLRGHGVVSLLLLPLIVRDQVVGTLGMDALEHRVFTKEEIALATNAAAAASQALENARVEQQLRESEERLKLALEGADLGLWDQSIVSDRGLFIQNWTEPLGAESDGWHASLESWYDRVHPDDRPELNAAWHRFQSGETPLYEVELRLQDGAGEWRWILLRGNIVERDEQGNPLRLSGIHQDITARKLAERALRRSQQRLSLHVQHTPLAYIEWNDELKVVDWNPSAERIFGYSAAEAKNRHAYDLIVPPEVQPHVALIWQRLLQQTGGTRSTNENMTKDGRRIVCEWYNTPLIDERGRVIGLASLVQDITERVQGEEALRQAKESAEQARKAAEAANQAKSAFLANMSHELRTPLNAILGFVQLMTRDRNTTAPQRENLDVIGRSGEHLLDLINDVLEMSKIEAGGAKFQEESFDLHLVLTDLEEMFGLRARDKGLQLIFDRAPDVPQYVRTDEGKLRQTLTNLLSNAVKFTSDGGITVRVRQACADLPLDEPPESGLERSSATEGAGEQPRDRSAPATCRLEFEVQDTGPGIAPDELDALFDPFVQTESGRRSQEGTGLGLPISRQFVELMGGELSVTSELGAGSVFAFHIQVTLVDEAELETASPVHRVIGLEPDQPVYRLLVVEDRDANRKLLVKLLNSLGTPPDGFEVREAANGREALEIWQSWHPHLILMDLRMPVMDGYEATRRIKATAQGQATVIVALTASAFEQDRALVLSEGCDDFVRKPFREEEIFEMLTKHLGVQFIYEQEPLPGMDEGQGPSVTSTERVAQELTPDDLRILPAAWLSELRAAATQLDADRVYDLLDQLRSSEKETATDRHALLADRLAHLVQDFRFDTIIALTTPQESQDEPSPP